MTAAPYGITLLMHSCSYCTTCNANSVIQCFMLHSIVVPDSSGVLAALYVTASLVFILCSVLFCVHMCVNAAQCTET